MTEMAATPHLVGVPHNVHTFSEKPMHIIPVYAALLGLEIGRAHV